MSGWNYKPVTPQQEAEKASHKYEEMYRATPPCTPSRLNPIAKPFYPASHHATLAVDNNLIGFNNSLQSAGLSPREDDDTTNPTYTTSNPVTQNEIMDLIRQVIQGDSHKELICELFQRYPMPGQPATIQLTPSIAKAAITHHRSVGSSDTCPAQATSTDINQEGNRSSYEQAALAQSVSIAIATVQPSAFTTTHLVPDISSYGYRFAMMVVCMQEKGFELPRIDTALRDADYNLDLALETLLSEIPASAEVTNITALKDAVFAQTSPVRPITASDTTIKGTSATHSTSSQPAPKPRGVAAQRATPTTPNTKRPCGSPKDFQCVRRSFQRAMLQANTEAALAPRRPIFDPTKHSENANGTG